MPAKTDQFVQNFVLFVAESLDWCCKESEREASSIYETLSVITDDVARRSKMSETAIAAVESLKVKVCGIDNPDCEASSDINILVDNLRALSSDNAEVKELTNPVIEALQFQDRLRQNLENISKSMLAWSNLTDGPIEENDLGELLLKCMTSPEERDLVRQVFTSLPVEETIQEDALFF